MLGVESEEQTGEAHLGLVAARLPRDQRSRDGVEASSSRGLDLELGLVGRLLDGEGAAPVADAVLDFAAGLLAQAGDAVDPERRHR